MKHFIIVLMLLFAQNSIFAQQTQTVKGQIIDAQSQYPIIGATIIILDSNPLTGTTSDENGFFKLEKVALGRLSLKVTSVGYKENVLQNLLLTAGKELIINVTLEESTETLQEIVVTAEEKGEVQNEIALLGIRAFSVEETSRYAGARNDPARMAMNFAGVSGANDGRNDIIIRGNSPSGLLWRLEGLDIFSPNHFAAMGTTGGPVSMLNNNVLANSDFMIGAFPAQYGNAVSGVFDLKMRSGNHEKHEFLGQIGFNGVELGAEGYLSKKKRSSYLVNYRYSALGIFKALGIPFGTGDAIPYYQDLSFKVDLPSGKNTKIFVFGVGGKSNIALKGSDKSPEDLNDFYGNASRNIDYGSYTYSGGISLMHFHNQNTFSKLIAGITTLRSAADIDTVLRDADLKVLDISRIQERNLMQAKYTLHYQLNTKMGAKNTLLSGFIADFLQFDLSDVFTNKQFESGFNKIGSTFLGQIYTDWQHKFNDKATLNLGLHAQSLALNQSFALEPRLAFKYQASSKLDFSLGYGRLSQMQGLQVYFVETYQNGKKYYTNEKLGFTLNNQVVAGAGLALTPKARLKFETYYQYLTNVPIEQSKTTFSMLNAGADFGLPDTDSLQNKGTGRNMGIELTLEHFFTDSYYYLFTVSVFDSKYTGSDGVERNTSFNGNYVSNALIGKEFRLNDRLRLSIDLKATFAGGRRYTPINLTESIKQQATIWETEKTNELQFDAYFRADGRVTLRRTGKKNVHQEWAFDVQNITNHQNIFAQEFNVLAQKVIKSYQLGFFPVVQYRILF